MAGKTKPAAPVRRVKTVKYARKPFYVDAIEVTPDNMSDLASWTRGELQEDELGKHIKIKVHRPLTERQTTAYVGDWILNAGTGFKVYTPQAFEKSFERVTTLTKDQADKAGITPPIEPKPEVPVDFGGRFRSTVTGQFVSEDYAARNQSTTVKVGDQISHAEGFTGFRSAETGFFVTEEFAKAHPDITVEDA